ncbi:MAG: hypothetical protein WCK67_09980 [bacterium]
MAAITIAPRASLQKVKDVITWTAPSVFIPSIRYLQDPPDRRNELFARDFTTYSIGAGIYFIAGIMSKKLLDKTKLIKSEEVKEFISFLSAITFNILYASIGAIKISQHIKKESKSTKNKISFLV